MKPVLHFLRTTITGGILFLIPVVISIIILNRAKLIMLRLSKPLTDRLPDIILGLDGSNILAIVLLILVCFVAGLIFHSKSIRRHIDWLEENVLAYLPGYTMIKSIAADVVGHGDAANLKTVLVKGEDGWSVGFLSEQDDKNSVVFIPEAPRHDSGELKIVPNEAVKIVNVPTGKAARYIQRYGKGTLAWANEAEKN
ncbi:DUF502 domain-containing protein [Chryseolinea sp. T2]|uniref:DUF502 domain-containing protein n=1 Tax=Chryseolinea sp. T2 TaxID=3129255 RepID=UPI0030780026